MPGQIRDFAGKAQIVLNAGEFFASSLVIQFDQAIYLPGRYRRRPVDVKQDWLDRNSIDHALFEIFYYRPMPESGQ